MSTKADDGPDEWDQRILNTGCYEENLALQLCHADNGDWRKCLGEMETFRKCWQQNQNDKRTNTVENNKTRSAHVMLHNNMLTRSLSSFEPLISLEDSDLDLYENVLSIDPRNLELDISKLKAESSSKFRRRWDEIIAKFSAVDDERESDEIDLHSGKITVDNGHLRSLRSDDNVIDGVRVHSSIWAGDYDFDKDVQYQRRRQRSVSQNKHELKQKLKAERRFHNSGVVTSDLDALEDNLLILLSPTKRTRLGLSPLKSPMSNAGSSSPSPKRPGTRESPSVGGNRAHGETDAETLFEQNLLEWQQVPALALYNCAFRDCGTVCDNRAAYGVHLLHKHSPELQEMGYPVHSASVRTLFVDEITILRLNLHFPLKVELPENDPYVCGMDVGGRSCRKLFLKKSDLLTHRRASPISCSGRRQVLSCPLLGCTFMTDVGFDDYRKHVLSHEKTPKSYLPIRTMEADVSEYFSDSVSSFSFSDSERETEPGEHAQLPPLDIVD